MLGGKSAPRIPVALVAIAIGVATAKGTDLGTGSRTYGTGGEVILQLPALFFTTVLGQAGPYPVSLGYVSANLDQTVVLASPVHLPNGALITRFVLYYFDAPSNTTSNHVRAYLGEFSGGNGATQPAERGWGPLSSTNNGYNVVAFPVDPPLTVNNSNQYFVQVDLSDGTALKFKSIDIRYHLQVSPAPESPTFGDVPPSHPYFRVIEALGASGITTGCGGGNFCPDDVVTRAQMAKFLANALGLNFPE